MDEKQIFSEIIKDLLLKTTLSKRVIAERSGYAERNLYYLQKGAHKPSLFRFCKILRALGEDPIEIVSKIINEAEKNGWK